MERRRQTTQRSWGVRNKILLSFQVFFLLLLFVHFLYLRVDTGETSNSKMSMGNRQKCPKGSLPSLVKGQRKRQPRNKT